MKQMFALLLLFAVFLSGAAESVEDDTAEFTGVYAVESGLGEDEREISGSLKLDGSYDAQGALARLWDRFMQNVTTQLKSEFSFGIWMISVALVCSISVALSPDSKANTYLELSACCGVSLLLAGSFDTVFSQTTDTLNRLSDYAKTAVPAFFATVAASGTAVSASVKYASVCFAIDAFIRLSQDVLLPLIYSFLALSICESLFENTLLSSVGKMTKWCALTALTLFTTAFCVYISLAGVISGSTDVLAVKATKTVISTTLPVIGGILSDSASSILAAAGVIKNSAGVFCLLAVCALCVGPFAVLLVKMLVFRAAAAISEQICGGRLAKLIGNMGAALAMLLALVGSYGIMLFLSFMSGIRVVSTG